MEEYKSYRRSDLEIYESIVETAIKPILITNLRNKTGLSGPNKHFIENALELSILEKKICSKTRYLYQTTEKGLKFLEAIRVARNIIQITPSNTP